MPPFPAPAILFPAPPVPEAERDAMVRDAVLSAVMAGAQPPDFARLADTLGFHRQDVCASFRRLAAAGVVTLWPGSHSIRLVPPFLSGPGDVRVGGALDADGARAWWAAGLWHALGIPGALEGVGLAPPHLTLRARDPVGGADITLQLVGPVVLHDPDEPEPIALLTRPFASWWNDPTAAVDAFRLTHALPAPSRASGSSQVPLAQLCALARAWHADRLQPHWRPRTSAEARALVEWAGLEGAEWHVP